jgi:hypothetical protein
MEAESDNRLGSPAEFIRCGGGDVVVENIFPIIVEKESRVFKARLLRMAH